MGRVTGGGDLAFLGQKRTVPPKHETLFGSDIVLRGENFVSVRKRGEKKKASFSEGGGWGKSHLLEGRRASGLTEASKKMIRWGGHLTRLIVESDILKRGSAVEIRRQEKQNCEGKTKKRRKLYTERESREGKKGDIWSPQWNRELFAVEG